MSAYDFVIEDSAFNGETASAYEQYQALHIVCNSQMIIGIDESVSDKGLVMMVMALEWSSLQRLETLLVKNKLFRSEDGIKVGINLFRDNISNYALMVGKVARENLRDFFSIPGDQSSRNSEEAGDQTAEAEA